MSVIFKGMEKPPKCEWFDENHNIHRCPLLDDDENCKLQNCDPYWSWYEQYEGCPIIEIPSGAKLIDVNRLKAVFDRNVASANEFDVIFDNAPIIFEEG